MMCVASFFKVSKADEVSPKWEEENSEESAVTLSSENEILRSFIAERRRLIGSLDARRRQ